MYIRDGLGQMERNAAAGRTPSSVPLPTPPPAALNLSPRFGPLSPVHNANPLNDSKNMNPRVEPTNFILPSSHAETDHVVHLILSRWNTGSGCWDSFVVVFNRSDAKWGSKEDSFRRHSESRNRIVPSRCYPFFQEPRRSGPGRECSTRSYARDCYCCYRRRRL